MLSVIVPVYKAEKYLPEALQSLIKQEMDAVEFILVCGDSSDSSLEIAKSYVKQDSRFRIIQNDQNDGYGFRCNAGISQSQGDYVAFCDPDDYVSSKMYRTLYSLAKKYGTDIIVSNYILARTEVLSLHTGFLRAIAGKDHHYIKGIRPIDNKNLFYGESSSKNLCFDVFSMFAYSTSGIWSNLYKKKFLLEQDIEFPITPGYTFQDYPFHVETLTKAHNILFSNENLYYHRIHSHNASVKIFKSPYRYIHTQIISDLLDKKAITQICPVHTIPYYYRAFLWQYLWAMKNIKNPFSFMRYCKNLSVFFSSHPWVVDESFSIEEKQMLSAYKKGKTFSQLFYTLKALASQPNRNSLFFRILVMIQKFLIILKIIQKI